MVAPTSTATATRRLSQGSFAFVMGTGIVATAVRDDGAPVLATTLLAIAGTGYVVLVATLGLRAARRPKRPVEPTGFAALTTVPATNVLSGNLAATGHARLATGLLAIGVIGWLGLGYAVPLRWITIPRESRDINGTWFLWVVATQSVALAAVAAGGALAVAPLLNLAEIAWGIGVLLYLALSTLALAHLMLHPRKPTDITPALWVYMGSAAITVYAGTRIAVLDDTVLPPGFVTGLSVILWSFASWLIPLLTGLTLWRHRRGGVRFRYETGLWSMVFPIGMYGVATHQLGSVTETGWLTAFGTGEAWFALAVWAATAAAMLASLSPPRHSRFANRPSG